MAQRVSNICVFCGKQFSGGKLENHLRTHTLEKPFECAECSRGFATTTLLNCHKIVRTGEKPFKCNICGKKFARKKGLNVHTVVHGTKDWKCDICGRAFARKCDMTQHRAIHSTEKPFTCKICQHKFRMKPSLWQHIKKKHTPRVCNRKYCVFCPKYFVSSEALNGHIRSHIQEKPYKICPFSSKDSSYLKIHLRTHRVQVKPIFQCNLCNKIYESEHGLNTHIMAHLGEKPHKCKLCNMRFIYITQLNYHTLVHSEDKAFKYAACGKMFRQKSGLMSHRRLVHPTAEEAKQKSPRYQCIFCNKISQYIANLNVHIRSHTEEKPFYCELCGKRFTNGSNLNQHIRYHTKEKHFKCNFCSKSFYRPRERKRHETTEHKS